jgi:hypothetical protein
MRRLVAMGALAAALTGCGEKEEPPLSAAPTAVELTADLPRAPAAPPDAGAQAGHRAPDHAATTAGRTFSFRGRVRPAGSRISLSGGEVRMDGGRFRARVDRLRRGENTFVLQATAPGLRPARLDIAITRR